MIKKESRNAQRLRRHARVRAKISGTPECPRLNVFRSNAHIHVQIIDDVNQKTLVSASSLQMKLENGGNIEAAKAGHDWKNPVWRNYDGTIAEW